MRRLCLAFVALLIAQSILTVSYAQESGGPPVAQLVGQPARRGALARDACSRPDVAPPLVGAPAPPAEAGRRRPPLNLPQVATGPANYVVDANDRATILRDANAFETLYTANYGTPDEEARQLEPDADNLNLRYWDVGQRAAALAQMYDLVAPIDFALACGFLERLRRIAGVLLYYRDDRRPGGAPMDSFRDRVMPAWGVRAGPDRDEGNWNTDISTAGLLVYPMAAFARRVADTPSLHARYGADAIRFTTAAIETYIGFLDEQHLDPSDPYAYFEVPEGYRRLLCSDGNNRCEDYRRSAGDPISNNENLAMMRALADMALAADSQLYRTSGEATALFLFVATNTAPQLIARNFAFFDAQLHGDEEDGAPTFVWDHEFTPNGIPSWYDPGAPLNWGLSNPVLGGASQFERGRIEDTAHAQFSLACLAALLENKIRLNALLARNGSRDELALSSSLFVRFANTFLRRIWSAQNLLSENVDGSGNRNGGDNWECAGFIPLAQFDRWVWIRCRDATFRASGYLRVDNYAALLRYRQFIH